eukprot:1160429-Pelagomonas_calceolata.AAC.23
MGAGGAILSAALGGAVRRTTARCEGDAGLRRPCTGPEVRLAPVSHLLLCWLTCVTLQSAVENYLGSWGETGQIPEGWDHPPPLTMSDTDMDSDNEGSAPGKHALLSLVQWWSSSNVCPEEHRCVAASSEFTTCISAPERQGNHGSGSVIHPNI